MARGSVTDKPSETALLTALRREISLLDKAAIKRENLTQANGSLLGQITGHFRFVSVTPERQ